MINIKNKNYSVIAKYLHWLIAISIIFMIFLGFFMVLASGSTRVNLYTLHKSIGLTILIFMIIRVIWRIIKTPPPLPKVMKAWEKKSAHISHLALYLLAFIMPISGWIISTASNHIPKFWWWFKLPYPLSGVNYKLAGFANSLHTVIAWVLVGFICVHILAALKHHFINKDDVFKRML